MRNKKMNLFEKPPLCLSYDETSQKVAVSGTEKYELKVNGSDCKQVVNNCLEVWQPLTDKKVRLSFQLTEKDTGRSFTTVDYFVTIPGKYPRSNRYPKPEVIPELAEWHGTDGVFTTGKTAQAVIDPDYEKELAFLADEFCRDYEDLTGCPIGTRKGNDPQTGDFFFTLNTKDPFLGKEGYYIKTGRVVKVIALDKTGAYWATRTILQILKQSTQHNTLPCGEIRDYPKYPVRGFMLDIGRRPVSLAMLRQIIRNMAWYKMNDLQLHLNDNYIWLEDYNGNQKEEESFEAYEAFRLESSLRNDKGESPTARDYAYSKAVFKQLIDDARNFGIHIVPEIDVPAHALSFARVFPEYMVKNQTSTLMKKRPLTDHLDISRPEVIDFVKQIFDDYTKGENPVFDQDTVVHIGADEFLSDYGAYRHFFNTIIPYIKKTNPVRVWGGLTWIKDNPVTPIKKEAVQGVQMDLWSKDWADGAEMYQMGYGLINIIDQYVYMVPNGTGRKGSYQDYLNKKALYKNFVPYKARMKSGKYLTLPAGDPQVLGAAYAIWFDNIDKRAGGLTEIDLFERFFDALPVLAEKTWANGNEKGSITAIDRLSAVAGTAPCTNPYAQAAAVKEICVQYPLGVEGGKDISGNGLDVIECCNSQINPEGCPGLHLSGGDSYAKLPFTELGPNHYLRFTVKLEAPLPGQILFETDPAYGTQDIRITASGKLGFTREGYEYEFNYTVPAGKEIALEIRTQPLKTTLHVNGQTYPAAGKFIHNGTVKKDGIKNASLALPVHRIGSAANSIQGVITCVTIGTIKPKAKRKKWLFW